MTFLFSIIMKHIFLPLLLLFFTACTSTTHRDSEWVKQAEAHYDAGKTDSVLTYLYKINENKLNEEELRTFQRVKFATYIQTEPESFRQMRELADYYQQQKDTAHLQTLRKSLFRDYNFRKKYPQADSILNEIQRAYIHQSDSNGILWTYSMKASLHESGGRLDSALYYIDKRMASEKQPARRKYRYYQKAQLLMKAQAYTEAEALLDSAKAIAQTAKDEEFLYHLTTYYLQLYTAQGQYAKALQMVQDSRKEMKRKDAASHNLYKAQMYELMHREDSARYYYDVVAKSENLFLAAEALYHLSELAEADDNPEKAYLHHQDATGYIDQVYRAYQSQAKNNAFNELKWQSEIDGLKINHQQHIILILSLVLTIVGLSAAGIIYRQREKRKKMEARQIQMEQENRLLRQAEELSLLRDKANGLREELIRRMEVFQKVPSLHNESTGEDFTITLSTKDWKEIETLLNNQYDQFTHRLRKAVPALITADIQFCCLLKINVSMQDIANIYHINRESVSRRKQRIKSKIGNDLLQGLTLDEFIQRF